MLIGHPRIDYQTFINIAPGASAALQALEKAVDDSGLDKQLSELIKLRVSQINGCAFCIQYHLNAARKIGVDNTRLDLVAAWKDAGIFSSRESAALAWAESLTMLAVQGVSDEEAYKTLCEHFTQIEVVFLTVAIGVINNWNRLGAALRFLPPPSVTSAPS